MASECPCRKYVCKGHLSKMCHKKGRGSKPKKEEVAKVFIDKDADAMDHVEHGSHKPY